MKCCTVFFSMLVVTNVLADTMKLSCTVLTSEPVGNNYK